MKIHLKTFIALLLVLTMTVQAPVYAFAKGETTNQPDYISEVKIAMGSDAEKALEGYTILSDENGKAVDLNQGAGGGWGSQGDRRVILGYKTTKDQSEAITDLALMNMKGGYSVQEYEALIQQRMDAQVIPFIRKFQATINEYRENLNSSDAVNRARAEYIRAALNKYTDDDCGGAGLGDLFMNTTKFEMGDAAYNALPEAEKNQHCDIVTLFMQTDGQTMLLIYALLTRAADTAEDESWLDRFAAITYDDLLASYDMSETDAKQQMARDFEDDARLVLQSWEAFRELIVNVDEAVEITDQLEMPDVEEAGNKTEKAAESQTMEDLVDASVDVLVAEGQHQELIEQTARIAVVEYLSGIDYEDGTMYDFFSKSSDEIQADLSILYPLVASLSEGQRAGLEFISIRELVMSANRDTEYDPAEFNDTPQASVYEGVDRGIYEKGGVALTSDALRAKALEAEENLADRPLFSTKTIVFYALTGAATLGFIGSVIGWGITNHNFSAGLDEAAMLAALEKISKLEREKELLQEQMFD